MTYYNEFDRMACGKREPPPKPESHGIPLLELLDKIPITEVGYGYMVKLSLPLARIDAPVNVTILRYRENKLAL